MCFFFRDESLEWRWSDPVINGHNRRERDIVQVCRVLSLHHHCLSPLSGYRPQTNILHTSLSWAFLLRATHVMPTSFISLSMHLLHVSRGLPLPLEPCGFHWRACRVILFLPFLNVCPTHFHLRLPISVCIGTCPVLSHSCSFLILSVHFSFKIFLEHLFTNTWSLFMTPCVVP